MPYRYGYTVQDTPSANNFAQQETSDGQTVSGSYRVALPDGRIQIVTYTADAKNGYVAKVTYEGVAKV